MPYENFERFWKVKSPGAKECATDSIVMFAQTGPEKLTVFCAEIPYGEGTASYKDTNNTIEVMVGDQVYVISLIPGTPPQITFGPKVPVPGPVAESWTAEDYIPRAAPEPAGE